MDLSMLGKGKHYKGKGDRKGIKGSGGKDDKGKGGCGKDDEKGKGKKSHSKGKDNVGTAEYFSGQCKVCKAWDHQKRDC